MSLEKFLEKIFNVGTCCMRRLPAEFAHDVSIFALKRKCFNFFIQPSLNDFGENLRTVVPGIAELKHPIGLAAGFDKNCLAPFGFSKMGFSFLEIGTVTPLAQYGNPKPRVFRSPEQKALINRMGFGNDGSFNIAARLKKEEWNLDKIPLAINIGKNKTTVPEKAIDDYLQVLDVFKELSSFFVLNVSSPNTPGLRDLVSQEFFEELSQRIPKAALHKVWIKLDPDMDKKKFQRIVQVIAERGFQGLVLTNTHKVDWPQSGGQSGHPLSILSSARLEWAHEVHKGDLPMIASGGILSGIDIFEKLARGASAVEVYTAMVYRGPWAVKNLLKELSEELKLRGFSSVKEVIGSYY